MEIARFALVLTVAAIPVALPAVLSVTMAVGALNLARCQAIVSKLTAIEELAGVDVFCTDKTGTLTQNRMQIADPVVLDGFDRETVLRVAALASRQENNDPIELPIFHYIDEHLPDLDWREYRQRDFVPFDPVRKRTEGRVERDGETFTAVKGAAQILIAMSDLSDDRAAEVQQMVDMLASKGYRTLAVGRQQGKAPLELIGLIPLYDPPREDAARVIADMVGYGVQVKMVTGDQEAIAREIGRTLGLQQETVRAPQLRCSGSQELLALAEALTTALYRRLNGEASMKEARRFAEQVMEELKTLYDTRLLEREFIHTHESAIVEMIEQVDIFAEVVPEDKYRIVDTLQKGGHLVAMTGDGVNDAPALMIILLALLNDLPILAIAYDNTRVHQAPVRWRMRELMTVSGLLGVAGVVSSFVLFFILQEQGFSEDLIRSILFLKLIIAGHSTLYITRSEGWFWERPWPSPLLFWATFGTEILGTLVAVYGLFITPIGWEYALWAWAYALVWFFIDNAAKMWAYRMLRGERVV